VSRLIGGGSIGLCVGRAIKDWPLIKQVLDGGPAPSKLAEEAANLTSIDSPDNSPSPIGSSYGGGWYGYVSKDLRTELKQPVEGPYSCEGSN
jgi:hypothetical protein